MNGFYSGPGSVDADRLNDTTKESNVVDLDAYRQIAQAQKNTSASVSFDMSGLSLAPLFIIIALFIALFLLRR